MKPLTRLLFILCGPCCAGQTNGLFTEGKVTDVVTNKGLVARISYKSIPTGSIHGKFNDSTFTFEIFGTAKYRITAEADGYYTGSVMADPRDMDGAGKLTRNIMLIPKAEKIALDHLIFQQGKADIEPSSFQELNAVIRMMKLNTNMVIQLEGHADNQGSPSANLTLSQKRVEAVRKYLVSNGVGKDRVKTKAFGGSHPLGNEMTPEERSKNRRVEMRILKI